MQRLKFNTDRGNKKPTYRRKIKINPSESAGGFSLRGVVVIAPSVFVCVFFFLLWRENSCGKPVPADPGAPVAAVRTDDDDGDDVRSQEQRTYLPVSLIKIKHYIRSREREIDM